MKLKGLLPLLRGTCFGPEDENGTYVSLRPECEEWTWVRLNLNSGLLDLLGELTVQTIDAEEDDIVLWIETESYNCFNKERGAI